MRQLLPLAIAFAVNLAALSPAFAQLRREFSAQDARRGAVTVQVWLGSGTNLDFSALGQRVYRAWLDDPSRLTIDFDVPLDEGGAQIVHLRRITAVGFPGLPSTGTTLLSVVARDDQGNTVLYQFPVSYGTNQPEYSTIALAPDSPGPLRGGSAQGGIDLPTFRRGITAYIEEGAIAPDGPMYERLQSFIALVQYGTTPMNAATEAGISLEVVGRISRRGAEVAAERERLPILPIPSAEPTEEPSNAPDTEIEETLGISAPAKP